MITFFIYIIFIIFSMVFSAFDQAITYETNNLLCPDRVVLLTPNPHDARNRV